MTYISLVGTQIMAVLNPLLSLLSTGRKPDHIVLLPTSRSTRIAESLLRYLTRTGFTAGQLRIETVSHTLEKNEGGRPPVQELVSELAVGGIDIAFNLAGGMNFQVAACLSEIPLENTTLLYPEFRGVHEFRIRDGRLETRRTLPLPPPQDVLSLQDIPFQKTPTRFNPFLGFALKTCGIDAPKNALKHIRIGDVLFDFIWNRGNALHFLKVIHGGAGADQRSEDYLRAARDIMNLATGRMGFKELYHRRVTVLTNIDDIAERLTRESAGKVEVIHFNQRTEEMAPLRAGLRRVFGPVEAGATGVATPFSIETGAAAKEDGSFLMTALGPNIMPTLIALWSHAPQTVCLLHTPGIPIVEQYKETLTSGSKNLPVKTILFQPAGIVGDDILDIPGPASGLPVVNISPGTKGHAAFLALWARLNGGDAYSLDTETGCLRKLPSGMGRALNGPPPTTYLKLTGVNVLDYGEGKGGFSRYREELEAVRDFIRKMAMENRPISEFPKKAIALENSRFEPMPGGRGRIWGENDATPTECRFDPANEWFERLVGFAMAECGARDVQVRFRSRWSPEAEKRLKKRFGQVHLSDVDVIARFGPDYYVISCKATKAKQIEATVSEAVGFASLFGRFAVPMVCFLAYDGAPYAGPQDVYVFGHRTLTDTAAARDMMRRALKERRTTHGETKQNWGSPCAVDI